MPQRDRAPLQGPPHNATQAFEIGTPGLEIEEADTFEIGFKGASASFKKDEVLLPGASIRLFGAIKLN